MSVNEEHPSSGCSDAAAQSDAIRMVIIPKEKDLGGFSVRRSLPYSKQRMLGPWVFFDHMGPVDFPPEEGVNVRPHPHIGLATVTYLFDGEILHRDSLGSVQPIRPGAVNLMVAGKGITHSERTPAEFLATGQHIEGLQLWLALPEKDEETAAAFFHYAAEDLPLVHKNDVALRVMIGEGFGVTSPVKTYSPTFFAEAAMVQGASLTMPDTYSERAIYVANGSITLDGVVCNAHSMVVLNPQQSVTITAQEYSRVVIIGGEPLGERHVWWNFISSDKARIEKAKEDWKQGRFPAIPDDNEEFIPLPE